MSAHTPGPWSVINEHFGTGWTDGHEIEAEDGSIARTYRGRGDATNAANARLIAAAPALLDALESLDAALNLDGLANQFPSAEEPVNKIKAAIRLAKGDSL